MWIPRDLLRIPFVEVVERPEEMAEEPMSRRVTLPVRTRRSLRSAGLSVTIARGVVNVTAFTGVGITALTTVGDFVFGAVGSAMADGSACSVLTGSSGDGSRLSIAASAG